jgi:hypothetical protein
VGAFPTLVRLETGGGGGLPAAWRVCESKAPHRPLCPTHQHARGQAGGAPRSGLGAANAERIREPHTPEAGGTSDSARAMARAHTGQGPCLPAPARRCRLPCARPTVVPRAWGAGASPPLRSPGCGTAGLRQALPPAWVGRVRPALTPRHGVVPWCPDVPGWCGHAGLGRHPSRREGPAASPEPPSAWGVPGPGATGSAWCAGQEGVQAAVGGVGVRPSQRRGHPVWACGIQHPGPEPVRTPRAAR